MGPVCTDFTSPESSSLTHRISKQIWKEAYGNIPHCFIIKVNWLRRTAMKFAESITSSKTLARLRGGIECDSRLLKFQTKELVFHCAHAH